MTLMERIILGALLCMLVLAAALTYDPLDRYQYDQAESNWRLDSYGK